MKRSRYGIGIDLGTTNSALAYISEERRNGKSEKEINVFEIPQLAGESVLQSLAILPSFLYLPGEYELPEGSIALPWDKEISYVVGEFARIQGARIPANLVSSAKSWLSHSRVDREGPILPWGKETAARRISPVDASASYLRHMKDAWNYSMARAMTDGNTDDCLENQDVAITIPASFDESARELTLEAARRAGLRDFTMLEEPQAAFYSWLALHEEDWRSFIEPGRLILVFDMGGGTTDFTLITIEEKDGRPVFRRVAVGEHILLGGDNMDLALARELEKKLLGPSGRLDFLQWLLAVQQCRIAKEKLLDTSQKESAPITLLGKGRKVVGEVLQGELTAGEVRDIVLEGFFGTAALDEGLQKGRSSGLQELGLPFVSDTEVMRHLSSFLKRHAANEELPRVSDPASGVTVVRPDILLFNGGVFKSNAIRERVAAVVREWFSDGQWSLGILENERLDHAVALGAAYYSAVRAGRGTRIAGGMGRAYYIGVESTGERVNAAMQDRVKMVCVLPRGFEEGEEIHLAAPEFQVLTNSPVSFTLYSSSYRTGDKPGDVVVAEKEELVELPPVKTVLHFGKSAGRVRIPVSLGIRLNEFGTLDIWCESKKTPHRWKLAFQLRMEDTVQVPPQHGPTEAHVLAEEIIDEAIAVMKKGFLSSPREPSEVTPENVVKKMEDSLGLDRNDWPLFAIRKMWDALIGMKERRKATARYEARWLSLSGFLLRPGFGYQLDNWRVQELWKLASEGLEFPSDAQSGIEWWIMWRRVAGGLDDAQQDILFKRIAPWLLPSRKRPGMPKQAYGITEMWMLAASLERLPAALKTELGNELIRAWKKWKGRSIGHYFWALSRIGARVPFHGPIEKVVPKEAAGEWIRAILGMEWHKPMDAGYALAQMARRTGDRSRDIDEDLRDKIEERLSHYNWAQRFAKQVRETIPLEWSDEKSIFGESLPAGLYLTEEQ
ncbi:MAG TPA: Hsp70 family protein [Dissulfurispiraceae bacterium]